VLPFTVYREDSRETLTGSLNGNPIEPGFAFATVVGGAASVPRSAESIETMYRTDDTLSVEAPASWPDEEDWDWKFRGGMVGLGMIVSADVGAFRGGYKTPGALVAASRTLQATAPESVLDSVRSAFPRCTLAGRSTFTRGGYTGSYDLWEGCKETTTQFLTIAATKDDGSHIIYIQFQAPDPADLAVLDRMLVTLEFTPGG
jgi:hypothetical protein